MTVFVVVDVVVVVLLLFIVVLSSIIVITAMYGEMFRLCVFLHVHSSRASLTP